MQMRHIQHACIDKCSLYLFLQLIQGEKMFETCNLKVPIFTRAKAHFMPFQNINVLPLAFL